jgi:hypothetical protein
MRLAFGIEGATRRRHVMSTAFDTIAPGKHPMRKVLLANVVVATLAAGALTSDCAEATPLAASAGAGTATEGASPIEQVAYRRYHHHRHYGHHHRHHHYGYHRHRYGYVPYRHPGRIHGHGGYHYR